MRVPPPSAPTRTSVRVLVLAAAMALLATGCSQGPYETGGYRPDPSPGQAQLVRTPSPVSTELPSTDPPLVQPLPGPSGAVPGTPKAVVPEASPGEDQDPGKNAPSN